MLWFATHVTANSQEALVEEEDFCHGSVHILEITMKGGEVAQPEVSVVHVRRWLVLGVHALLFIMAYMCYGYCMEDSSMGRQVMVNSFLVDIDSQDILDSR